MVTELGFPPSVRDRELHCRRGWGSDLWQATAEDVVIDIRSLQPDNAGDSRAEAPVVAVPVESPHQEPGSDRIISLSVAEL